MLVSQGKNLKMPRRVTPIQIFVLCLVILSPYLHQSLPSWFFHSGFGNKCLSTFIFSCVSHASTQFILLNFITPVIQSFNPALEESRPKRGSYTFVRVKLHQWNRQISCTCWKRPPEVSVHKHCGNSWCLVTYSNLFSYEDSRTHRIWNWWPWTNRWGTYPNRILLWLIVPPKYKSSNRKLHVRT